MKLIICEKPDQAKSVAMAIGGFSKKGMVYWGEFEGVKTAVTPCRGHLLMLKEPQEIMPDIKWDDPKSLQPIPEKYSMKIVPATKGFNGPQPKDYLKNIEECIKKADEVIIATDSDREGEAIGWEVIDFYGYKGPVRRAWFSGGTDLDSYKSALKKLYPAQRTKSWARASEARGRSDWMYQLLVRAYSYYSSYGAMGANLGRGDTPRERVVSVGRVQLPVVQMVYDRDQEIANFKSVDHFKLKGDFTDANIDAAYTPIVTKEVIDAEPAGVHWEPSKTVVEEGKEAPLDKPLFVDKNIVEDFKKRLMEASEKAIISEFSSRTKESHPPKAFNLMGAQKEISKRFPKLDAEGLQAIVEDLYEQGWISYPRTEHEEIPVSFYEKGERNAILSNIKNIPQLSEMAELAMAVHNKEHSEYKPFMPKGFSKKEMEHHGLLPTKQKMDNSKLINMTAAKKGNKASNEMMQFAYLAITKRFVQMMLPPAKIAEQKVEFTLPVKDLLGNEQSLFKAKAEQVVDQGWLKYSDSNKTNSASISFKKGDTTKLNGVEISSSKTTPPAPYTEIGLGDAMSTVGKYITDPKLKALLKHASGLGTPATRSTIVKTVKMRGYLEVKGKSIHCTDKGADLLQVVPKKMRSPEMTAVWEDKLMQIQEEKDDAVATKLREEFIGKQRKVIAELLDMLEEKYRPLMQEKRVSTGDPNRKPTEGMLKFAKQIIANSNGKLKAPRGMTSKFNICKEFIDAHKPETTGGSDGKPSEGQIKYANSIWNSLDEKNKSDIDFENILSDRKKISDFINKFKDTTVRKPTDNQISFATKLIDKLPAGKKPPKGWDTDANVCRKFIDSQVSGNNGAKKNGKQKK